MPRLSDILTKSNPTPLKKPDVPVTPQDILKNTRLASSNFAHQLLKKTAGTPAAKPLSFAFDKVAAFYIDGCSHTDNHVDWAHSVLRDIIYYVRDELSKLGLDPTLVKKITELLVNTTCLMRVIVKEIPSYAAFDNYRHTNAVSERVEHDILRFFLAFARLFVLDSPETTPRLDRITKRICFLLTK